MIEFLKYFFRDKEQDQLEEKIIGVIDKWKQYTSSLDTRQVLYFSNMYESDRMNIVDLEKRIFELEEKIKELIK